MVVFFFVFTIFFSFFTIRQSKQIYGGLLNHYSIMNLWWIFNIFLSFYNNTIYKPQDVTYYIFFSGLFFFNITVFFFKPINLYSRKVVLLKVFDIKLRRVIELIVLFFLIPYAISNYKQLLIGTEMSSLHSEYFNGEIVNKSSSKILLFIIDPLSIFLILTYFYKYKSKFTKYDSKINLLIILILIVSNVLISGGRTLAIQFLFLFVFFAFFSRKRIFSDFLAHNFKKKNIIYLSLFFICIIAVSYLRGHAVKGKSILETINNTYTLSFGIFDYYLRKPDIAFNKYTYGMSTFEGVIQVFQAISRNFFGLNMSLGYKSSDLVIQKFVNIGPDSFANAYPTMYFMFLRDWGYIGVAIGPILLAFFCHYIYSLINKDRTYILIYVFVCQSLTSTTLAFQFSKMNFVIAVLYVIIIKNTLAKNKFQRKKQSRLGC